MNALYLVVIALAVGTIAYRYYSAFIAARVMVLNDARQTPAHTKYGGSHYLFEVFAFFFDPLVADVGLVDGAEAADLAAVFADSTTRAAADAACFRAAFQSWYSV